MTLQELFLMSGKFLCTLICGIQQDIFGDSSLLASEFLALFLQ